MSINPTLATIAPLLTSLVYDPEASAHYDLLADGLIWSDEVPRRSVDQPWAVDLSCLRALVRYRTSLIVGAPDETHRAAWETGKRLFPTWPGFHPRRHEGCWAADYHRLKEQAFHRLTALERRLDGAPC